MDGTPIIVVGGGLVATDMGTDMDITEDTGMDIDMGTGMDMQLVEEQAM